MDIAVPRLVAQSATIAAASAAVVLVADSTPTRSPASRAAAAVTGPMQAATPFAAGAPTASTNALTAPPREGDVVDLSSLERLGRGAGTLGVGNRAIGTHGVNDGAEPPEPGREHVAGVGCGDVEELRAPHVVATA